MGKLISAPHYTKTTTYRNLIATFPDVEKIARVVIHRLNFPKQKADAKNWHEVKPFDMSRKSALTSKQRPALSAEDEREVIGVVALCLVNARFFERKRVPWLSIFRHVRHTLRIGRRSATRETHNQDAIETGLEAQISLTLSLEEREVMFQRNVPQIRAMVADIERAFHADKSRKRKAAKKSALLFLRYLVSNLKGDCGLARADVIGRIRNPARENKALHDAAKRFRVYLAKGHAVTLHKSFATI